MVVVDKEAFENKSEKAEVKSQKIEKTKTVK
jgi:hypothetical protein